MAAAAGDDADLAATTPTRPILSLRSTFYRFALPAQPNPLVGRNALVDQLTEYLERPQTRLLTLVGPGGIGKTSLACELARRWQRDHDIVRFIDLTQISDSAGFATLVDEALGPTRLGSEPNAAQPILVFGNHRILVILDNFEHVIDAAPQIAEMLSEAPWLQVIATSRTPLRIRWELACAVPPLEVPRDGTEISVDELATISSVALFTTFAQRIQPAFTLTPANADAVAEICRRMEGLPLALELAANDLRAMPIERLAELAERPLDLLVRGPRDLPQRQQAMHSSIEWSYQLMAQAEQRFARQIAIFPEGGTIAAVSSILQLSTNAAYDAVAHLVEQNLLERVNPDDAQPRFRIPRMVHEYLTERLEADAEQPSLVRRFTDYYTQLITDTCEQLTGPNSSDAAHTLQAELGNVRSILGRSIRKRHIAEGLTLALMLVPFWERPEHLAEGRSWLSRLIALAPNAPTLTGDGQIAAARLAILAGDLHGAAEVLDITAAATSEPTGRADMPAWVCAVQLLQGKLDEAEETLQTVLDASAAGVTIPDEVSPAYLRALLAVERNDAATTDLLAVALAEADQEDNPSRAITILCKQAERELTTNRTLNCARILADALVRAQVARNPRARISPLIGLGDLAAEHQSRDEAVHHYREALDLAITCQDAISQVRILERIAVLGAAPRIQPDLLGAIGLADTLRTRFGHGRTAYDEGRIAPALRRARELLGDVEFERIRATGDTRSIAQVLQGLEEPRRAKQRPSPTIPANAKASSPTITQLTRREREVVQQISRGHTNKQIAATLGMAERTVDSHIGNIRQKLQVQSRAQIAVWAVAHGLSNPD